MKLFDGFFSQFSIQFLSISMSSSVKFMIGRRCEAEWFRESIASGKETRLRRVWVYSREGSK